MDKEALRQVREQQYGLKLALLPDNPKYEVGKTYFCGYWKQPYVVLDYSENPKLWRGWSVTVKWKDGSVTTHCTPLEESEDFLVVG